jgi:hypothetical protein
MGVVELLSGFTGPSGLTAVCARIKIKAKHFLFLPLRKAKLSLQQVVEAHRVMKRRVSHIF